MSNDKHRTVCHKVFYRLLHDCFRLVIQRGSRFVQNNYRRIFDESTGNRNPLFLPAGKQDAAFADFRIQTFVQRIDKLIKAGAFYGIGNLFARSIFLAEKDIIANRTAEKEIILKDDGNFIPQRIDIQLADVYAVYHYLAAGYVIESGQQIDQRGFTAAGIADKSNGLADFYFQVNVVEHGFAFDIREADIFVFDAVFRGRQQFRSLAINDFRRPFQNAEHTFHRHQRHLDAVKVVADTLYRIIQHNQRGNKRNETAGRYLVRYNQVRPEPDNCGDAERYDKVH